MYNHIEVIQMNTSNYLSRHIAVNTGFSNAMKNSAERYVGQLIKTISSGIKGIDQLVQRYGVCLNNSENQPVPYTHFRAHEIKANPVCGLPLEKKKLQTLSFNTKTI